MGEFVQQSLEELLPVFEQIERVQLFTGAETNQIVKRCRAFEYRLQRQLKNSSDFLRYISYLEHFSKLIKSRREAINYWYKKAEIDGAVCRKIESLYRRACERFQGQLHLWLARIDFAKKQKHRETVSRHYLRLLQIHSHQPKLWVAAARFEFDENGSAENARNLLQRALRFHPDSESVWKELFQLELRYVEKILDRKAKLDSDKSVTKDSVPDAVLELKMAELVFEEILQKTSDTSSLILALWKVASGYDFAKRLADYIFDRLLKNFPNNEAVWQAQVERAVSEIERKHKLNIEGVPVFIEPSFEVREKVEREVDSTACGIFEAALGAEELVSSERMWRIFLNFFLKRLPPEGMHPGSSHINDKKARIISIFERMDKLDLLHPDDFLAWNKVDSESGVLSDGIRKYPKSATLWKEILRCQILNSRSQWGEGEKREVMKNFNSAIQNVPEAESLPLWELALKWTVQLSPEHTEKVLKSAQTLLTPAVSGWIRIFYLQWTLCEYQKMDTVRKLFRKLCQMPPNSLDVYSKFIEMEKSSSGNSSAIREAFEHAVREHGTASVEIWLQYLEFEKSTDPSNIPSLYQRALTMLIEEKVEDFVASWTVCRA